MCNPWSANYWGDALITSQAAADEYACFRRIVGSLTVVQSGPKLIVLPKLRGILGDLRVVFPRLEGRLELQQALAAMLPELEEIRGDVELQYTRGELPGSVAAISSKR